MPWDISSLICCLRHFITALTCLTPAASFYTHLANTMWVSTPYTYAVHQAIGGEVCNDVQVTSHMDLDKPGWCGSSMVVGDVERDVGCPLLCLSLAVLWHWSLSWCWVHVSWGLVNLYRDGSVWSSVLAAMSSLMCTHPLGRDFFCWVSRWYLRGIFVVFIEGMEELSCQCCGVFTIELKWGHALGVVGWRLDR